ncbi:hypothetical protein SCAR479_07643 [Seiridium cardinale]|uniref:Uncharacterized protein n=1 Tax=Seiridium cardinale TaxID=138064 RepID=A0ABR2XPW7_9PEZI
MMSTEGSQPTAVHEAQLVGRTLPDLRAAVAMCEAAVQPACPGGSARMCDVAFGPLRNLQLFSSEINKNAIARFIACLPAGLGRYIAAPICPILRHIVIERK